MAINVSQAFKRTSKNPIDETFALTKAQMLTVNDNLMPDYYFTVCQDDGCFYLYDKSATASPTTGKFTKFEGGTDSLAFGYLNEANGKFYKESTYSTEIAGNTGKLYITLDTNYIYRYDATNGFVQVGGSSTGGSVEGYLNPTNGKFYEDSTYTTEISGEAGKLYVTIDTNKVYRYDSTNGFVLVGGGDGETIQYDTMPTASSTLVGTIVQYVGSTTATYTKGYWYECVLDGATYKWQNIQVQEGGGESGSGISVTATLLAASWDAQNQQTVTFTGYQASMNGVIGVPASATDAQKEAYASALVRTVAQNGNQFTFECESIPSIDLPVTIYAGGSSGSGTGGHTIIDGNGQSMTSRDGLQFIGATVTDDSTNNKTVVTIPNGGHTIVDGNGNDMTKRDDLQFVGMSVTDDAVNGRTVVTLDPSIYKPAGDKTSAELISSLLVVGNLGNVYNITTAGTTTADFVGGAGNPISIGDNVAIVDVGSGTYKFDLLGGFVDLSGKADKVSSATNGDFAGLDTNGNLIDSGKKATDFADIESLAAQFDDTTTYAIGDRCTYNGKVYRFTSSHTGAWVAGDVTEVTVDGEIPQELTAAQMQAIKDAFIVNQPVQFASNPVGCIIQMMGITAPAGYLACDGTAYNIADFPFLAAYFESQFGTKNHFGGDGTTTFAVPDLRGEFLRGTGTNSHSGDGNGAAVGTHQEATRIPLVNVYDGQLILSKVPSGTNMPANMDTHTAVSSSNGRSLFNPSGTDALVDDYGKFTVRPTNTSVLYCIKY